MKKRLISLLALVMLLSCICTAHAEAPLTDAAITEILAGLNAQLTGSSEPDPHEALHLGDNGSAVRTMQIYLKALGHLPCIADGSFGPDTMRAIIAFQTTEGLEATGIADKETLARLFSLNVALSTEDLLHATVEIVASYPVALRSNGILTFEKKASFTRPGPGHWFVDNGEREMLAVLFYFDLYKTVNVCDSLFGITYIAYNSNTGEYILCFTNIEAGKDCWLIYSTGNQSVTPHVAKSLETEAIESILTEGGFEFAIIDKNKVIQLVQSLR